jgi:hypothetical protein
MNNFQSTESRKKKLGAGDGRPSTTMFGIFVQNRLLGNLIFFHTKLQNFQKYRLEFQERDPKYLFITKNLIPIEPWATKIAQADGLWF